MPIFRGNIPTIFGDSFKISVRFTLKELRCEFSSSFDIISGSEERGILFLQIVIVFGIKKKNKKKSKKKLCALEFFHKQEEKRPFNNLTRIKASREGIFFN